MSIRQEVTIDQFVKFADRFGSSVTGSELLPVMKTIAFAIQQDVKKNFDEATSPDGVPWAPLRHARPRGGDKPLRDTGVLMASATAQAGPGAIRKIAADAIEYGTNVEYAAVHQHGATIRPSNGQFLAIPATVEATRQSARDFPEPLHAIIGRSGRGGVLLDREDQVQYFLTRQVVIPPRPFIGFGLRLLGTIDNIILDFLEKKAGGPIG